MRSFIRTIRDKGLPRRTPTDSANEPAKLADSLWSLKSLYTIGLYLTKGPVCQLCQWYTAWHTCYLRPRVPEPVKRFRATLRLLSNKAVVRSCYLKRFLTPFPPCTFSSEFFNIDIEERFRDMMADDNNDYGL